MTLTKATFNASFWMIFSHGFSQTIRFVGNLILTRLLIPEDFGLMQLVFVFLQGIVMFSDLGILPNLLQHPKGEDPLFLKTTWTVQFLRGILIEIILILLAYPLAVVYQASPLIWLIPLAGLNAIIDGTTSTNLLINFRKMDVKKIAFLDVACQFVGMIVMLIFAWHWRSVWTLLISSFVSGSMKAILSHVIFPGPRMAFTWVPEYIKDIFHFGKWIFVSSIAGFLFSRLDKILLGLYLSLSELGFYGIAFAISIIFVDVLLTLNEKVLIPLYTHLKEYPTNQRIQQVFKVRASLMLLGMPPLIGLMIWGQALIDFLYPTTFREAGWMLEILSVAACLKCITLSIGPVLYAEGNSFRAMVVLLTAAFFLILAMIIQGALFETKGVIWSIATAEILNYPILIWAIHRYGTWLPWLDLSGFLIVAITVLAIQ